MVQIRSLFSSAGLAVLMLSPVAEAMAAPVIAPHRAVYDLSLAKTAKGGQVSQAHGKLEFEWADACTSWSVIQRTHVRLIATGGQVIEFGWRLSALEAKDGSQYRYFIRRLNTGEPPEEVRGKAQLSGPGQSGSAALEGAEGEDAKGEPMTLPKGTLFPTTHSLLLLEAAERGDATLGRVVFDGTGDEGIAFVNAAMSAAIPAGAKAAFDSPLLHDQKSWRMSLAYFGLDESISKPEHEQAFRLYANGVVDDLILDYGDFALRATLETLEAIPGGC